MEICLLIHSSVFVSFVVFVYCANRILGFEKRDQSAAEESPTTVKGLYFRAEMLGYCLARKGP